MRGGGQGENDTLNSFFISPEGARAASVEQQKRLKAGYISYFTESIRDFWVGSYLLGS
jgi:hypothetical protein